MLPLVYSRSWQIAGVLILMLVLVLALAPAVWPWGGRYGSLWAIPDKWLHGLTFAGLALWYTGQYARHSYLWLALGLFSFGSLIELGQLMVAYRTAELGDVVADTLGIAAGMMIALVATGGWSLRVEQWLRRRIG